MSLSGKVVLITGSSKGIGKAAALRVASEGASVVINYLRDPAAANNLVGQIGTDRALAVQADASKLSDLDRLVDAAVAKFGKIDVLIPNAGILALRTLEDTSEADFDRTYNLMVKGPYFLAQVCTRDPTTPSIAVQANSLDRKLLSTCPPADELFLYQPRPHASRVSLPHTYFIPLPKARSSRWPASWLRTWRGRVSW